jgi:hypothetical protein
MRLLNTRDLKLHEFMGDFDEPYAILSHTWGSEECTLQHMLTPAVAESRAGFRKIKDCCKLARQNGFEWAWVDT